VVRPERAIIVDYQLMERGEESNFGYSVFLAIEKPAF
jgi:hypothetical protein